MNQESTFRKLLQNEYTWLVSIIALVVGLTGQLANLDKNIALTNQNIESLGNTIETKLQSVNSQNVEDNRRIQKLEDKMSEIENTISVLKAQSNITKP